MKNRHLNKIKPENNYKLVALILLAIIFFGFFLRLLFLSEEDYWLDEGFTLISAKQKTLSDVTFSVLEYETAPPLYFYILHFWIKLFGDSSFSTRYLSVLFSIFSIMIFFLVCSKISNKNTALLASFLFSISLLNIWISQETRQYSLMIFLSLLSTLFLVDILNKRGNNFLYFLYFISILFCLYTFYLLVFVLFFHFMYLLFIKEYKLLKKVFFIQFLSVLLLIPWLFFSLKGYSLRQNIVSDILLYHANLPPVIAQFGQFILIFPLIFLSLITIFLYLFNLKYPLKNIQINYNLLAFVISLFFIIYFIWLLNFQNAFVRKSFTWFRYFVFLLPVNYFIMAKTISLVRTKIKILLLFLIIFVSFFALFTYYSSNIKEDWNSSTDFIKGTEISGKGVIFIDEGGGNMFLLDYYYGGDINITELAWRDKQLNISQIREITKDKDFAWLILSRNWKRQDFYKNLFDETFNFELSKEFYGIKLYLYKLG